ALITIERASMFDSNFSLIHTNKAFLNLEADRIDDALVAAKHSVSLCKKISKEEDKHEYIGSRLALAMVSASAGLPNNAIPLYNEILDIDPNHSVAAINACFVRTLDFSTPAELLSQRKRWYDVNKFTGQKRSHNNNRTVDRVLKVG